MKLKEFCNLKTDRPEADFWIVRRGSRSKVGMPVREFNPEHFGVTVTCDDLLADYLFYALGWVHSTGAFEEIATGTTNLVNIRKEDILNIEVKKT